MTEKIEHNVIVTYGGFDYPGVKMYEKNGTTKVRVVLPFHQYQIVSVKNDRVRPADSVLSKEQAKQEHLYPIGSRVKFKTDNGKMKGVIREFIPDGRRYVIEYKDSENNAAKVQIPEYYVKLDKKILKEEEKDKVLPKFSSGEFVNLYDFNGKKLHTGRILKSKFMVEAERLDNWTGFCYVITDKDGWVPEALLEKVKEPNTNLYKTDVSYKLGEKVWLKKDGEKQAAVIVGWNASYQTPTTYMVVPGDSNPIATAATRISGISVDELEPREDTPKEEPKSQEDEIIDEMKAVFNDVFKGVKEVAENPDLKKMVAKVGPVVEYFTAMARKQSK